MITKYNKNITEYRRQFYLGLISLVLTFFYFLLGLTTDLTKTIFLFVIVFIIALFENVQVGSFIYNKWRKEK